MAKEKKPDPFIIVFANLLSPLSFKPQRIKSTLKSTLKDAQRQHPQFKYEWQKLYSELDGLNNDSVVRVVRYCEILRDMVFQLANYEGDFTLSWMDKLNKFLENVSPIVKFNDNGKFVVSGMARSKSDYISELSLEIIRFLTEDYRPGLVSTCGLYECKKYIVTWTGQKYCTAAHMRKRYDQQRLTDKNKANDIKKANRLNKEYHRKKKATPAAMKKKYSNFGEYKKANWHKDIDM